MQNVSRTFVSFAFAVGLVLGPSGCGYSASNEASTPPGTGSVPKPSGTTDSGGADASADGGDTSGNANGANGSVKRQAGPAVAPGGVGLAVVPMQGCTLAQYYAGINFGDDHLSVLLDTGSATVAVAAQSCKACGVADAYDASTGKNLGTKAQSSYVDGTGWSGVIYSDSVTLGPLASPLTPAVPLRFAAITGVVDNTSYDPPLKFFSPVAECAKGSSVTFEGIFGLGPDNLLAPGATGYLTSLYSSGKLANDAFAMQVCDTGGNLMLGGYATNTVSEQPFFVPMLMSDAGLYYYSINVARLGFGGVDTKLGASQLGAAVVDSGTNHIIMPPAAYQAMFKLLAANKAMNTYLDVDSLQIGDCMGLKQPIERAALDALLPKLQLTLSQTGGTQAVLELDASRSYLTPFLNNAGVVMYCALVAEGKEGGHFILGNPTMRQNVTIFDRVNKRIGFAKQTGCPATMAEFPD